ncbi:hypothetical protein SAMN05216228_107713 [Rhizobium tibeticum]|uniref:Uncharacterized protein n=1 Tax=Rhizobium tibeticum TaxID=501024 RepID=A0A1H8WTN8_9HYPH|nr:hypothetical protein RTCCBAU85039_6636 [Rhizobium tibeticum]SEP30843.1 hypothetical protein SAMN05216228_107713 [Rhizobium tibeticum]
MQLNHLFASFMFEIDIDIGRLVSFLTDEAFKRRSLVSGSIEVIRST